MVGGHTAALQERARRKVAELEAYEARHPGAGPDADGRPYDPWHDVIADPRGRSLGGDDRIDAARTQVIARRTWEGFAWADHRFVLSDARGNAVIVGFNEDAGRWFVDTNTPVRLPAAWMEEFLRDCSDGRPLSGLEDPAELHDEICRRVAGSHSTVPSRLEVEEHLRTLRG